MIAAILAALAVCIVSSAVSIIDICRLRREARDLINRDHEGF